MDCSTALMKSNGSYISVSILFISSFKHSNCPSALIYLITNLPFWYTSITFDIASFNEYFVSDNRYKLVLNIRSSEIVCEKGSQFKCIISINKYIFLYLFLSEIGILDMISDILTDYLFLLDLSLNINILGLLININLRRSLVVIGQFLINPLLIQLDRDLIEGYLILLHSFLAILALFTSSAVNFEVLSSTVRTKVTSFRFAISYILSDFYNVQY